jgi:hypothetical protein
VGDIEFLGQGWRGGGHGAIIVQSVYRLSEEIRVWMKARAGIQQAKKINEFFEISKRKSSDSL